MEPPRAQLPGRGPAPHRSLRLAATAAALALILSSSGDAFLVAVLVGLAAMDVAVAGIGVLAALAVLGRWGTTSLSALAGLQAVVGPAGLRGEGVGAASSWVAALALVVACAALTRRWPAAALGLLAGLLVAGPAAVDPAHAGIRAAGALVGSVVAVFVAGRASRRAALPAAGVLAAVSVALAVAA